MTMNARLRITVRSTLIIVAGCALVALVVRGILDARTSARRAQCANNLKQIGLALHNYHAVFDCFPPAYIADASGKPMHSWRLLILPFMESTPTYNAYNFDEPWNGPGNTTIANMPHYVFTCPNDHDQPSRFTSYVALVGPGTAFPGASTSKISDVRDGISSTIMVVQIAGSDIGWTEPRDLDATKVAMTINGAKHPGISSMDGPGANILFMDGHVSWIMENVPAKDLKAWLTIAGGEPPTGVRP
jgi:prepilin-type processing-associated H-X9-DG protein